MWHLLALLCLSVAAAQKFAVFRIQANAIPPHVEGPTDFVSDVYAKLQPFLNSTGQRCQYNAAPTYASIDCPIDLANDRYFARLAFLDTITLPNLSRRAYIASATFDNTFVFTLNSN